ncbi:hypothetical protein FIBSPDRAFT_903448 [Athelia psychrophila]|uniref:Uncharacterized protein n=1 Tax=Athelia psychrophila TaxID=1759441 RepID=A0A167VZL5_9AGAM|nr:hypothetical protein FIBSPDRAFT_903448 [Fibularhizoctonia sp. CBS 109695]
MLQTRPHAAPRARAHRRSPTQEPEQQDTDASVSITINVPANLAAETDISGSNYAANHPSAFCYAVAITAFCYAVAIAIAVTDSLSRSSVCAAESASESVHPNDPVPNIPTSSRRFYYIGGHWRKADTYQQAMEKWDTTPASQKAVFTAD